MRPVAGLQGKKLVEAARALYTPAPKAEEAALYGLTVEEASGPAVEIWPDNLQAVNLFITLSTQWRTGASGVVGLDYGALYHKLDRLQLTAERYQELEEEIRTMEGAVLNLMAEMAERRNK